MSDIKTNEVKQSFAAKPGSIVRVLNNTAEKTKELLKENSVVGEKIEKDDVTVIPVSKLSIGFAGGGSEPAGEQKKSNPAGAGAKVTLTPVSFLVIKDGEVKLISATEPSKEDPVTVATGIAGKIGEFIKNKKAKKENSKADSRKE